MVICICHRITDRDIAQAVRSGTRCFGVLQENTGVASSCGCCHDCARELFEAACADTESAGCDTAAFGSLA